MEKYLQLPAQIASNTLEGFQTSSLTALSSEKVRGEVIFWMVELLTGRRGRSN
jgi:hypothetical protein